MTDATQTWLLLLPDGSHNLLGRHGPPTDLGLQHALATLAHQGISGAWLVRMEGDYHRPRSQLAMHQLATLAAPGVPYNDALALFLQRRTRSNAAA